MQGQTVHIVSQANRYIEGHLYEKMDLDMAAAYRSGKTSCVFQKADY